MSGIGAIFHRDGRPVERDDLERMSRSLAIYGPEKRAIKSDGAVGFAYTHFSNTAEARGAMQPLSARGGRITFVFDGRIDNREQLAEALSISASDLARMSDAALALAGWEAWGVDGLNRWVGEFAAISWDRETREVSMIRDQFGRRPLHYHLTDKRLLVASMPKGIHALGDVPRELDPTRLTDVLTQFDIDLTRSYYRGIDLVAPANVVRVTPDRDSSTRYYKLRDHVEPVRYKHDEDYLEAAQDLFDTVMRAYLRSPGKVGSHLSAGLDSSLVTAVAAQQLAASGERLSTYTWVPAEGFSQSPPPGMCFDESPAAHAMAQMYSNLDVHLVGREGPGLYDGMREYFLAAESVVRNGLNLSLLNATGRTARSDGVKVMLSGGNGNLTLSYNGIGAPYQLFRQGKWRSMLHEINRHPNPRDEWRRLLLSILPERIVTAIRKVKNPDNIFETLLARRSAATADATAARNIPERARDQNFAFVFRAPRNDSDQWITFIENYAGPVEANTLAAMPALFGHELRDPFFDRRILEWRFGVPDTQFRRDGRGRYLMRRLISGKVPDLVAKQQLGRGVQSADWHARLAPDLDRIRRDLETASSLESLRGVIDREKLATVIENFPQAPENTDIDALVNITVLMPLAASVAALAVEHSGTNSPPAD